MILLAVWSVMIMGEWFVAALSVQKIRKQYPWFVALTVQMAVTSLILFYIRTQFPHSYFYAYYRLQFLTSVLQIAATVEVFAVMFRPYWTVPPKSLVTLVLSTSVTLAIVAKANVVFAPYSGEIAFYQSMDRVVSCSVGIALAAVLLFSNYFGMPMRSRIKGISIGLYVMSVTDIVMSLVWSNFDGVVRNSLAFVPVVAHYATLATWCYYVGRREALVAVLRSDGLPPLRKVFSDFRLALSNTPTSCGLTLRKEMGKAVVGEQKAKVVNHNG